MDYFVNSHAPWPNRALVVPEFIFIGGRSNSGRLGSIAASPIVDTLPLIKTTTNSNTILQQCPTDFFYFYWNSTLQVSPKVKKVLQLLRLRQQWRVHQAQQGYHQHAPHLWWVVRHCPRRSGWCFSAWSQSWHWTAMLIKGVLTLIQSWALNWSWSFLLRLCGEKSRLKEEGWSTEEKNVWPHCFEEEEEAQWWH